MNRAKHRFYRLKFCLATFWLISLYSGDSRWMQNEFGVLVEWYTERNVEVLWGKLVAVNPTLASLTSNPDLYGEILVTNCGGWLSIPGRFMWEFWRTHKNTENLLRLLRFSPTQYYSINDKWKGLNLANEMRHWSYIY